MSTTIEKLQELVDVRNSTPRLSYKKTTLTGKWVTAAGVRWAVAEEVLVQGKLAGMKFEDSYWLFNEEQTEVEAVWEKSVINLVRRTGSQEGIREFDRIRER